MLNLFFHTRCKQTKFCNKQCELDAHTKEKSTKKEHKNLIGTEDLLKKVMEAEMKKQENLLLLLSIISYYIFANLLTLLATE